MATNKQQKPISVEDSFYSVWYNDNYGPLCLGHFRTEQEALDHASVSISRHPKGLSISVTFKMLKPKQAPYEVVLLT